VTQGTSFRQFVMRPILALSALASVITLVLLTATVARAQSFYRLYSFCSLSKCTDGRMPTSVIQATTGEFYGTTSQGGANVNGYCPTTANCGTVFKITPSGKLTTLYTFCSQLDCADGERPVAALIQATNGDFYGVTQYGGTHNGGTIFKITPSGVLTTLYNFCSLANCADGILPVGGLMQASNGDFYGTTSGSLISDNTTCTPAGGAGCGTVFKITPAGKLTTLYTFCSQPNCADGAFPSAALMQATNGDLYGTTALEGPNLDSAGTIFKITPTGDLTTLVTLCSQTYCSDGELPVAPLLQAANGDLYGTTEHGGISGAGTVFQMTLGGTLSTLYTFCSQSLNCGDGGVPLGAVIQGTDGNFYGGTSLFGASNVAEGAAGTAFQLTPSGVLTVLHTFCATNDDCPDGLSPNGALLQATNGDFYGTTEQGGAHNGGEIFLLNMGLGPFVALQRSSGVVGAKVTILGTDLIGASSVTFNGTPATFTINAIGTAITATVPQGATTGTVQVVTPNGTLQSNVVYRVEKPL